LVREFLDHADDVKESNCKLKRKHAYGYEFSGETIFSLPSTYVEINFLVVALCCLSESTAL